MAKRNEARRAKILELYQAGKSIREIAVELKCSFQNIHGMLLRLGIPRRPRGGNQGSHSRHRK